MLKKQILLSNHYYMCHEPEGGSTSLEEDDLGGFEGSEGIGDTVNCFDDCGLGGRFLGDDGLF